jgi:hypothetical protein
MKELNLGDSKITFDPDISWVVISGILRLPSMAEYEKIGNFLREIANQQTEDLTLDFSNLEFLNSSGITAFSLFILHCKKLQAPQLQVIGNPAIPWQDKSIKNFQKLWSEIKLTMN